MRILSIGRDSVHQMTHQQAHQAIIRSCNDLELEVYDTAMYNSSCTTSHHMNMSVTQSSVSIDLYKPTESQRPQSAASGVTHLRTSPAISPNGIVMTAYSPISPTIHNHTSAEKAYVDRYTPVYRPQGNITIKPSHSSSYNLTTYSPSNSSMTSVSSNSKSHQSNQSSLLRKGVLRTKDFKLSPICHVCQQQIHGPFIDTNDHCYCPNHFICAHCHQPLNEDCFTEQNGKLYCERDFQQYIACRCGKCHQPVIGKIIKAMNQTWHPNCFTCHYCQKPLDDKFYIEDIDCVLCEEHWKQFHERECAKCKQPIIEIDRFIEACGKQYHAKCFCCSACQTSLEGKPFHSRDQKPFCVVHANAVALFG
ncbi:unnamed protein product [Heterobilharzia americana]|nr:unnamed protein product [Heterobilharzia americana]